MDSECLNNLANDKDELDSTPPLNETTKKLIFEENNQDDIIVNDNDQEMQVDSSESEDEWLSSKVKQPVKEQNKIKDKENIGLKVEKQKMPIQVEKLLTPVKKNNLNTPKKDVSPAISTRSSNNLSNSVNKRKNSANIETRSSGFKKRKEKYKGKKFNRKRVICGNEDSQ